MTENPSVVIVGAGGHALVIAAALRAQAARIQGFLDPLKLGQHLLGLPVLGGDELFNTLNVQTVAVANGIGVKQSLRDSGLTGLLALHEKVTALVFVMQGVVHPNAVVSEGVTLGIGAQVMAGVVLQPGVRLGAGAVINTGSNVDHECAIGDHAFIAPGVTLCGSVTVGEQAFIGAGAVVLPGIRIGARVVIAAGAIVRHDVGDGQTFLG